MRHLAFAWIAALAGCGPRDVNLGQPAPQVPSDSSHYVPSALGLRREGLNLDQLAEIVGVSAWRFHYKGGPPLCWLEIEETNQDTLPDRIPAEGGMDLGPAPARGPGRPPEGHVVLWWKKGEANHPGQIVLRVDGRGSVQHAVPPEAFVFGWSKFSTRAQAADSSEPIAAEPGQELTLMTFEATESTGPGDPAKADPEARRIAVRLKAKFPDLDGQP